jgi:hypothetical protein
MRASVWKRTTPPRCLRGSRHAVCGCRPVRVRLKISSVLEILDLKRIDDQHPAIRRVKLKHHALDKSLLKQFLDFSEAQRDPKCLPAAEPEYRHERVPPSLILVMSRSLSVVPGAKYVLDRPGGVHTAVMDTAGL